MTDHILSAWKEDMDVRLHGGEPALPRAYVVHAHEVKAGEIYRDSVIRVTAIPVDHGSRKFAYGYRFEAKDKVIVISGDTTYSRRLIEAAKGTDILIHEVYSGSRLDRRESFIAAPRRNCNAGWQRNVHSTATILYSVPLHCLTFHVGRSGDIRLLGSEARLVLFSFAAESLARIRP
jgi:ribonuclease BN (tRNA processing enzyme)